MRESSPYATAIEVKEFRPQPRQETFLSSAADIAIYGGSAGAGKHIRINELVPTPTGWTTMGAIQAGDVLLDEQGRPCTVLIAHPITTPQKAYRLHFDEGSTIDCGSEHLWWTYTANDLTKLTHRDPEWQAKRRSKRPSRATGKRSELFTQRINERNIARAIDQRERDSLLPLPTGSVKTTQDIVETLTVRNGTRSNHAIPVCQPWLLPKIALPIPPYTLGAWLGDGSTNGYGSFASADIEVIDEIRRDGFNVVKHKAKYCWGIHGLVSRLKINRLVGHKHIPLEYRRASFPQRLALLQGLMDTDGTAVRHGCTCEYTTILPELADHVFELAISLGFKTTLREKRAKLNGLDYGPCFTIAFSTRIPCFRLPRKLKIQCKHPSRRTTAFRYIVAAEPIPSIPMRCLTVDSPSRLYLVGRAGIPTHNTFALLLEPLRHIDNPDFGAIIFRREAKQITTEGGLRDTAMGIYPFFGGEYRSQPRNFFRFPSGARISFEHLHTEDEVYSYQGSQITMLAFDELTHFSKKSFTYLLSRNRSICGVKPYVRCSCNADADSWVADLIRWWIDQRETLDDGTPNPRYGLPIMERSGVLRYFFVRDEQWVFADTKEELVAQGADTNEVKTLTFIPALVWDNPALLNIDPGYIANLKAQSRVERARLLDGNWKVRPSAGLYFNRYDVSLLPVCPNDVQRWVRSWDLAATELTPGHDPDWTVGVRLGRRANGNLVVVDVIHTRRKAADVRTLLKRTADLDGRETRLLIPQDPGQAGVAQTQHFAHFLSGYPVEFHPVARQAAKTLRAEPVAAQWQVGNIEVVKGYWNQEFFDELEAFPTPGVHDDIVDALVAGVHYLIQTAQQYAASQARRGPYAQ